MISIKWNWLHNKSSVSEPSPNCALSCKDPPWNVQKAVDSFLIVEGNLFACYSASFVGGRKMKHLSSHAILHFLLPSDATQMTPWECSEYISCIKEQCHDFLGGDGSPNFSNGNLIKINSRWTVGTLSASSDHRNAISEGGPRLCEYGRPFQFYLEDQRGINGASYVWTDSGRNVVSCENKGTEIAN